MSKRAKRKIILIDGIRYYADRPDTCRKCFFWKNRKVRGYFYVLVFLLPVNGSTNSFRLI